MLSGDALTFFFFFTHFYSFAILNHLFIYVCADFNIHHVCQTPAIILPWMLNFSRWTLPCWWNCFHSSNCWGDTLIITCPSQLPWVYIYVMSCILKVSTFQNKKTLCFWSPCPERCWNKTNHHIPGWTPNLPQPNWGYLEKP